MLKQIRSVILLAALSTSSFGQSAPPQVPEFVFDRAEIGFGELLIDTPQFVQFSGVPGSIQKIYRRRKERSNSTATWFMEEREYSVPYWITAFCARNGGDDIFIAGVKANGDSILEHWRFNQPAYRYTVDYQGTASPIGIPLGVYAPVVRTVGGGQWKWTKKAFNIGGRSSGSPGMNPTKTTLFEGPLGPITAIAADPEGRFLLLFDYGTSTINQFVLGQSTPTFPVLYDLSSDSKFVRIDHIEPLDFKTPGERTYQLAGKYLDASGNEVYGSGTLKDQNNDGVFEAFNFTVHSAFLGTPYAVWSDWISLTELP